MDLIKFAPNNLVNLPLHEIEQLTNEDIKQLALEYPNMDGQLLIQRATRIGAISSATYRSLDSLLRSGHKFVIVGVKDSIIKPEKTEIVITNENDYIAPEKPIFVEKKETKTRKKKNQ